MRVKTNEVCFVNGHRRRAGDEFEYSGPVTKYMTVLVSDAPVEEVADSPLTNEELHVRLAEYGVKVAPNAARAKMIALLAEAEGK